MTENQSVTLFPTKYIYSYVFRNLKKGYVASMELDGAENAEPAQAAENLGLADEAPGVVRLVDNDQKPAVKAHKWL